MAQPRPLHAPARPSLFAGFVILSLATIGMWDTGAPRLQAQTTPSSTHLHSQTPTQAPSETETGTATEIAYPTASETQTPSPPPASTQAPSLTATPTIVGTQIPSPTPSPTPTPRPTPTPPAAPSTRPTAVPPRSVLISEVAWAGTLASAYDEWIELHNPGPEPMHLDGWRLISQDGGLQVTLGGVLGPYGFFLLERTDDTTVADIAADQIYTGSLSNGGETLLLLDPVGNRIDSANPGGGGWPAGDSSSRASMERRGRDDRPGNWATFPGSDGNGHDAAGNPIPGTPRQPNAIWYPTPTPTTAVVATPSAT